jgi:hypothetical protein
MFRKVNTSVSLCEPQVDLVTAPSGREKGEYTDGNGTEVYKAGVLVRPTVQFTVQSENMLSMLPRGMFRSSTNVLILFLQNIPKGQRLSDHDAKYDRRCTERPDDSRIHKSQNHVFVYGQDDLEITPSGRDPAEKRFDVSHVFLLPCRVTGVVAQSGIGSLFFSQHDQVTKGVHLGRLAVDGKGGSFKFSLRSSEDDQKNSNDREDGKYLEGILRSALGPLRKESSFPRLTQ